MLDVTGGAMHEMGGRIHLVFGQDFQGGYVSGKNGIYSKQIRSFDINDDGASLSISNISITPETEAYRRRDLNVFPVIRNNELDEGLVVLSGVFTGNFGVWSVLVEIDANGLPTMADPAAPKTFKQAMNNYHSAKLGLYSEAREEMHELLFGGITLQYYDEESQQFLTDNTVVGHIFFGGGIFANAPHVRNSPTAVSDASNRLFEVVLVKVPEPSSVVLPTIVLSLTCCLGSGRGQCQKCPHYRTEQRSAQFTVC